MRTCLVTLLVFLLGGCVSTPLQTTPEAGAIGVLHTRVEYMDRQHRHVPAKYNPRQVTLVFPLIPGQIFGNPDSKPVFIKALEGKLEFSLALDASVAETDSAALSLRDVRVTRGLQVSPAATRFARLATFAFNSNTGAEVGGAGFIDAQSRDHLILIYADRACRITGTLHTGDEQHRHDIVLPGRGFHWVRVHREGGGVYVLRHFLPDNGVLFSITLLQLQQT